MGENLIPCTCSFGSRAHSIVLLFEAPSTVKWLVCTSCQNQIKVVRIRKPTHLWYDRHTVQQHHKCLHETFTCICPREVGKPSKPNHSLRLPLRLHPIQCAVSARYNVRSLSDQRSVVNKICPSAFWRNSEPKWGLCTRVCVTYLHLLVQDVEVHLPSLHDCVSDTGVLWNVFFLHALLT